MSIIVAEFYESYERVGCSLFSSWTKMSEKLTELKFKEHKKGYWESGEYLVAYIEEKEVDEE